MESLAVHDVLGKNEHEARVFLKQIGQHHGKDFELVIIEEDGIPIHASLDGGGCCFVRVRIKEGRIVSCSSK
jgi:hypothetical protein